VILELHAIQSFAPANLNRDDTGAPKECVFGGVRRARVSSQSWKRAIRMQFRNELSDIPTGTRTKRAHQEIVDRLLEADPTLDPETARRRAAVVLEAEPLGLSLKQAADGPEVKTGQLLFFRDGDLDTLAAVAREYSSDLDELTSSLDRTPARSQRAPVVRRSQRTSFPKPRRPESKPR
jgi:CRISPR system Cascade subunit CasC